MDLFHRIDDAEAILRLKGGVFKQTELYRRGGHVYIKASGGYVRIGAKFGDTWGTSAPAINVLDMSKDIKGLAFDRNGTPCWTGSTRP